MFKLDKGYYTKVRFLVDLLTVFSSISATFAPVEYLLSTAGKVFRPERGSLKDDTFEKLNMMIKCNYQIKSE